MHGEFSTIGLTQKTRMIMCKYRKIHTLWSRTSEQLNCTLHHLQFRNVHRRTKENISNISSIDTVKKWSCSMKHLFERKKEVYNESVMFVSVSVFVVECWLFRSKVKYNDVNYTIIRQNGNEDQCDQYVDLYSFKIGGRKCRITSLVWAFSTNQKFHSFHSRLEQKISDLFQLKSKSSDEKRHVILFVHRLERNDRPFDYLYQFYHDFISNVTYLPQVIHYDRNYPQWNLLQMRMFSLNIKI